MRAKNVDPVKHAGGRERAARACACAAARRARGGRARPHPRPPAAAAPSMRSTAAGGTRPPEGRQSPRPPQQQQSPRPRAHLPFLLGAPPSWPSTRFVFPRPHARARGLRWLAGGPRDGLIGRGWRQGEGSGSGGSHGGALMNCGAAGAGALKPQSGPPPEPDAAVVPPPWPRRGPPPAPRGPGREGARAASKRQGAGPRGGAARAPARRGAVGPGSGRGGGLSACARCGRRPIAHLNTPRTGRARARARAGAARPRASSAAPGLV
jgi:hypothetical protein